MLGMKGGGLMNIYSLARQADCTDLCRKLGLAGRQTGQGRGKYRCPFHDDHDPSMITYPQTKGGKSHYHCFSCGAHGDAIDLYARIKGLSGPDAARELARELGYDDAAPNPAPDHPPANPAPTTGPDMRIILLICQEWRKYCILCAEQSIERSLRIMEQSPDPDSWIWRLEARQAAWWQDQKNMYAAMTDRETLDHIREEFDHLDASPF